MQDLLAAAEATLAQSVLPIEVEAYKNARTVFREDNLWVNKFADDTYAIGRTLKHVLYSTAMVQKEFATAGQELHPAKSQMLASGECEEASLWSDDDLHQ